MILQWNIWDPPWNMKVMVALSFQALSCQAPKGDSDNSDGSSVDGSCTEEIVTEGDDGNYDNDSWKCTGEDCSADELLDRYTFSPPAVGGHPRNCIPPDSRPEECLHVPWCPS